METSRIRKSLICYKTSLNESELAWKAAVEVSQVSSNECLYWDDIFKLKVIQCFNSKCSEKIYYSKDVVLKKCNACSSLNCMECSTTHERNNCIKLGESKNDNFTEEAEKKFQLATHEIEYFNYVKALMHYSEAITLKPDCVTFLSARSCCLIALGNYELASDDALKAISLDGKHQMSYYAAMDCYIALGDLVNLENLITQWKRIASNIDSVDEIQVTKLMKLKTLHVDINEFLVCANYEKCLECVNNALKISIACDELHLMKMRLHVILKLPVTEKMLESTTNKYIERFCGTNFFDLLQLFYNDDLRSCMATATKMLELLPKKFTDIVNILHKSHRFIDGFQKAEQLCVDGNFTAASNVLRDLQPIDQSNEAVTKRLLHKLAMIESSITNKNPNSNDTSDNQSERNTKYSFTTSEVTDNRNFFDKLKYENSESSSERHHIPNEEKPDTRYSFSAVNLKHSKEQISKPKRTWAYILGDAKNREGGIAFSNGNYNQAHILYGRALSMCPNSSKFLTNRSACLMKLNRFKEALDDAVKAIDIDEMYLRAYLNAINISLILGEISQADVYIATFEKKFTLLDSIKFNEKPKLEKLKNYRAKVNELYEVENYQECLIYLTNAMKIATHCENLENLKAECLVMSKRFDEAEAFINEILQKNPMRTEMLFIRGLKAYFAGNLEESVAIFEQVLRKDRKFTRATTFRNRAIELNSYITKGAEAMVQEQYEEARKMFIKALDIDPKNETINCHLFYRRGEANFRLKSYKYAYFDFTEALKINEGFVKALVFRAHCHFVLNELEDCLIDCEELLKNDSFNNRTNILTLAEKTKLHLRSKKPRNNFEILEISVNASLHEIKAAFRKLSLLYHSDKNPNASAVDQKKFKRKFQEIKGAYDSLRQSYI